MALLALIGGMVSVAYTDALSAFMMVFGFMFSVSYLSRDFGGLLTACWLRFPQRKIPSLEL